MDQEKIKKKKKRKAIHKVLSALGVVLCVVFGFFLVCNLTIIVKGYLRPDLPPSVLGLTPMVTLSGSMSGEAEDHIEVGDLIFVGKAEPETLAAGDIIAYMNGSSVITHRIIEVQTAEDGTLQWITKGDANNTEDQKPVPESALVGKYKTRIPKLGDFVLFMQKPAGMLTVVGVPTVIMLIYDAIQRRRIAKLRAAKQARMQAEMRRLQAIAAGRIPAPAGAGAAAMAAPARQEPPKQPTRRNAPLAEPQRPAAPAEPVAIHAEAAAPAAQETPAAEGEAPRRRRRRAQDVQ